MNMVDLPSGKLTWLLKMASWQLIVLVRMVIFQSYVNVYHRVSGNIQHYPTSQVGNSVKKKRARLCSAYSLAVAKEIVEGDIASLAFSSVFSC